MYIFPSGSGSVDPDPRSQNLADPTDPDLDPKYWVSLYIYKFPPVYYSFNNFLRFLQQCIKTYTEIVSDN